MMEMDPVILGLLVVFIVLMMASSHAELFMMARLAKWLCRHHPEIWRELGRPGTIFFKGEADNGYSSRRSALLQMHRAMPMLKNQHEVAVDDTAQRYLRQYRWVGRYGVMIIGLAAFAVCLGLIFRQGEKEHAAAPVSESAPAVDALRAETKVSSNEMMKDDGAREWRFPVEDFRIKEGCICIARSKDLNWEYFDEKVEGEVICTGFRLECEPIKVPGGAYGYGDEEITQEPEVMIDVVFPFESLAKLEGKTIPLGEPMEECQRELGSMYLFASHNEVRWQEIRFGKVSGDTIELEVDVYLDVDYDTGTTQFRHTLKGPGKIEKRWEE